MRVLMPFIIILTLISCTKFSMGIVNGPKKEISISVILVYPNTQQKGVVTYLHSKGNFGTPPIFVDSVNLSVNKIRFEYIPNDSLKQNRFCYDYNLSLNNCYNYYTDKLQLKPGERYFLNVQYKNVKISGETIIPEKVTVYFQGRKIFWTKCSNAYLFRIQIIKDKNEIILEKATHEYSLNLDSTQFSPGNYKIKIEAIDKNFYEFITQKLKSSGLSDGFGVFGSVTVVEKEFRLDY